MLLLAYIGLGQLSTMLALSLFIAVVATLVAHVPRQRDDDLVRQRRPAQRASSRPVLRTSWPVLLLIAVLSLFVWPWQNERSAAS